jgi:DNA-directed RNA polymerase subunit RPC12/RpoP
VAFTWNRETISVTEITTALFEQYQIPTVAVTVPDGNQQFNFKKDLIPVQCSRCGHSYQISPSSLLSMKEMRGYTCGNCGNLSDTQLQQKLRIERLKIGRNTLIEMGIDPDAEDEEEKAKAEEEEEERA